MIVFGDNEHAGYGAPKNVMRAERHRGCRFTYGGDKARRAGVSKRVGMPESLSYAGAAIYAGKARLKEMRQQLAAGSARIHIERSSLMRSQQALDVTG
jgi:hypothetical protein